MDSIDIVDSTFSLNIPSKIDNISTDYTIYIYIGAALIVFITCMFIYKYYQNNNIKQYTNENTTNECSGGFCTMEQNVNQ